MGEKRIVDATEQYRSLFDTSTNAILIRDRSGTITMANRAAVSLLAAEREEDLLGRTYLEFVHPEDRAALENLRAIPLFTECLQAIAKCRVGIS